MKIECVVKSGSLKEFIYVPFFPISFFKRFFCHSVFVCLTFAGEYQDWAITESNISSAARKNELRALFIKYGLMLTTIQVASTSSSSLYQRKHYDMNCSFCHFHLHFCSFWNTHSPFSWNTKSTKKKICKCCWLLMPEMSFANEMSEFE